MRETSAVIPAKAGIQRGWTPAFAGVTTFLICVFLCGRGSAADDALAENQSRFCNVDGTVEILAQGSAQWVDAHIDLPLEVGDQIRVGDDGLAELSLAKNVFLILDSNTQVIVGHTTQQEGHLTLTQGALVGKVEPGAGSTGPWDFETPQGVCAIRGTEFAILHSEAHGTHLGVFKGAVQLSPAESATEDYPAVFINAHQEGVLEKHKPLKTLTAYSALMRTQFAHATLLQKRYVQEAAVWVPMTPDYRKLLREKFVVPVKSHPKPRTPPHVKKQAH